MPSSQLLLFLSNIRKVRGLFELVVRVHFGVWKKVESGKVCEECRDSEESEGRGQLDEKVVERKSVEDAALRCLDENAVLVEQRSRLSVRRGGSVVYGVVYFVGCSLNDVWLIGVNDLTLSVPVSEVLVDDAEQERCPRFSVGLSVIIFVVEGDTSCSHEHVERKKVEISAGLVGRHVTRCFPGSLRAEDVRVPLVFLAERVRRFDVQSSSQVCRWPSNSFVQRSCYDGVIDEYGVPLGVRYVSRTRRIDVVDVRTEGVVVIEGCGAHQRLFVGGLSGDHQQSSTHDDLGANVLVVFARKLVALVVLLDAALVAVRQGRGGSKSICALRICRVASVHRRLLETEPNGPCDATLFQIEAFVPELVDADVDDDAEGEGDLEQAQASIANSDKLRRRISKDVVDVSSEYFVRQQLHSLRRGPKRG